MRDEALTAAIEKVGGVALFARGLGISSQAVSQWSRVPVGRAADVEWLTGIPRSQLRPDYWGEAQSVASAGITITQDAFGAGVP